MAKKIFFFSLSLLVLVLIFLGAYNFAFKNNKNNPVADPTKKEFGKETLDTVFAPEGKVGNPINESVLGATMNDGGDIYYYSLDDRSLKKSTSEGKNKSILMSNLPGEVTRILWSEKNDKALLLLKQNGTTLWYSANIDTKALVPLKGEISRLSWDNFGEKIFYQYTDPATKKRTLNSALPDGSSWKKLTDLGTEDFFLASIPQSSSVSFWARPNASQSFALESVSITGESRHAIASGLFGADYLWSPNGEMALASASNATGGVGYSLRLIGSDGKMSDLAIPTLVSKATWSKDSQTLYYALPGSLPDRTVLPDDYFGKSLHSKDTFWKIDVTTGKKTRLVELKETTQAFDASDFFLSPKEDMLYFTDRVTKRLYRIEL